MSETARVLILLDASGPGEAGGKRARLTRFVRGLSSRYIALNFPVQTMTFATGTGWRIEPDPAATNLPGSSGRWAVILALDGQPSDDFRTGLEKLLAEPWGKAARRIAVAIGKEADLEYLKQFLKEDAIKPFWAHRVFTTEPQAPPVRWDADAESAW